MKRSNFTFCVGREHKTTIFFSFSLTLIQFFRINLQKNSPKFVRIRQSGINAVKFEAARIHFLSDFFVSVAVVVAPSEVPESGTLSEF